MYFSKRKGFGIFACVIIIIGLLVFLIIKQNLSNPVTSFVGDKIDHLVFKALDRKEMNMDKSMWYLIVLVNDLQANFSFIKYVDHLITNEFKDFNLKTLLFNHSPEHIIDQFKEENRLYIPILSVQSNRDIIKRLFQKAREKRAVRLIDPFGKIVFTADFIQENDVRQILERFLLGDIHYKHKDKSRLKIGDYFIPIKAIDIERGVETVIDKELSPHLWIIFTSNCVSCALKSNLMTYSVIENGLLSKLKLSKGLIFSPYFNSNDIDRRIKELNIQNPVYLAKDELIGIENNYYRSLNRDRNVIVTIIDKENKILYLESFQVFINQLKGDYFDKNRQSFH